MLVAVLLFAGQVLYAARHGRWLPLPVRVLVRDAAARDSLPGLVQSWGDRLLSWSPVHGVVVWLLDEVPLGLILGCIGLLLIRRVVRLER